MLMLRRGVATNDQEPLRLAEARQAAAGGLRVGQVPSEFAAAMYDAHEDGKRFWPRVTRRVRGAAHIVHATPLREGSRFVERGTGWKHKHNNGPYFCDAFNADGLVGRPRQLMQTRHKGELTVLLNETECRARLGLDECPFTTGEMRNHESPGELLPVSVMGFDKLVRKIAY